MILARPAGPYTDVASERSAVKRARACSEVADSCTTSLSVVHTIRARTAHGVSTTCQRELQVAEIVQLLFSSHEAMTVWLGLAMLLAAALASTYVPCDAAVLGRYDEW